MDHSDDYTREEDEMLWEIHQSRKGIMAKIEQDGIEAFNQKMKDAYHNMQAHNAPATNKIA